jgi:uncharacterized protein (DUF362 family)
MKVTHMTRSKTDLGLSRREFIQTGLAGGAAMLLPKFAFAEEATSQPASEVWVFHGKDKKALIDACLKTIDANGGLGKKDAKKLTLKVNAAWFRTPKQGANTDPELVDAFLKGCKSRGIKEIVLPELPCDDANDSFPKSGILEVAESNGAKMIDLGRNKDQFKQVTLPMGKTLKEAEVARDFLETDVLINMPVVKNHGGARMTSALKNWMGAIKDRGFWHKNDLQQCIADFSTFIKPDWNILDATRVMMDKGPKGPTQNMKYPDLVILSKDPVAADAYASTLLFDNGPEAVKHLLIAQEMGVGIADLNRIKVHKIEVE